MMHKLVMAGVIVGSMASVPLLYESNPAAFQRLFARSGAPSAAAPAPAPVSSPTPQVDTAVLAGRKVRVSTDGRGHFVASFKINGRVVSAMVDTGATLVALNETTARRIGINLKPADFVYKVNTANGDAHAAAATIESMQIGRIEVEQVQAVVLEDSALRDTLVGMSFLKRLGRYSVEGNELVLQQ